MPSQNLPIYINHLLAYFDLCGFNTGVTRLSTCRKIAFAVYSLYTVALVLFINIAMFQLCSLGLTVDVINYIFQYMLVFVTYLLTISESLFQKQYHDNFWKILQKIHMYVSSQHKHDFRILVATIILFNSTSGFLCIMWTVFSDFENVIIVLMYSLVIIMCHSRVFHYILCLQIVNYQLEMIEYEVKIIGNGTVNISNNKSLSSYHSTNPCTTFKSNQFKWIRLYYQYVWEMLADLNEVFGWSQVATILFCFYFLLTDSNYLLRYFHDIPNGLCLGKIYIINDLY